MRLRKMKRWASAGLATLLAGGALASGIAHKHSGVHEINNWQKAEAAYVNQGPRNLATSDAPRPPSLVVLVEASGDGTALGLEIEAVAQHLGQTLFEGSTSASEETLETFNEVICLAIFRLLENRIDSGDPREVARKIDAYLAASDLPRLDYPKAKEDLEKISVALKRASSTDELAREVAEAILC